MVGWCRSLALHGILLLSTLSVCELYFSNPELAVDREGLKGYFEDAREARKLLPKLDESKYKNKQITVWYLEHLLAAWMLEKSPWNAYHSGMGILISEKYDKTGETSEYYAVDFAPRITEHIQGMLHPLVIPKYPKWMPKAIGRIYSLVTASYEFLWENEGTLRVYDSFPEKFTNYTYVGHITPKQFNHLREWIFQYQDDHLTFEPVEIVINGSSTGGKGSSMCHDLFYNALYELHNVGFKPDPIKPIYRDHIIAYASEYELVDMRDWKTRRDVARFYKLFSSFMDDINEEFTQVRRMLMNAKALDVTMYLYSNKNYYRVTLTDPLLNYCYLPVFMPPKRAVVWKDATMCALEEEISDDKREAIASFVNLSYVFYVIDRLLDDFYGVAILLLVTVLTFVFVRGSR